MTARILLAADASADALAFSGLRADDLLPRANSSANPLLCPFVHSVVSIGMQPIVVSSPPNAGIDMLDPAWPPSSPSGARDSSVRLWS
jgi:hypothetical protein